MKNQECAKTGREHIQIILTLLNKGRFPCIDVLQHFIAFSSSTEKIGHCKVHGQ